MSDNAVDEILAGIDLNSLASRLDTDPETARAAIETAIPTLLGSLQANVIDEDGTASLINALGQHTGDVNDLDQIDTDDGRKILSHMFADDPQRIQPLAGQSGSLLSRLLPILAPLVMNWLAKQVLGGGASGQQSGSGDVLGDLLGGLFGGGAAGTASDGGLGDLLGQVLGGALGGSQGAPAPAGYPSQPSYPGTTGTTPGQWQIPGDTQQPPQTQQQGSDDILGDLLGQILGR